LHNSKLKSSVIRPNTSLTKTHTKVKSNATINVYNNQANNHNNTISGISNNNNSNMTDKKKTV